MSYIQSVRAELIKTRRSAAFWLCLAGGAFVPLIFFLSYMIKPSANAKRLIADPWVIHFGQLWQTFSVFLLPMFIILISSMLVQMEYKNNTWKQVYTAPQSYAGIYFSKLTGIVMMVTLLFIVFNVLSFLAAIIPDLVHNRQFGFSRTRFGWLKFLGFNGRVLIASLGIISIQYWISLRFRNFIIPVGIGLACLIATMLAFGWEHIYKVPFAYPFLTMQFAATNGSWLQNHEWNSVCYCFLFIIIGLSDMIFRKEKG